METVSKDNLAWYQRMRTTGNFGISSVGNIVSPPIPYRDGKRRNRIVYQTQGRLSGFTELYEDIKSFDPEETFFDKTFEGESLYIIVVDPYPRIIRETTFDARVSSNSSVTEDRLFLEETWIDLPAQQQFSPDFFAIKKWISLVVTGTYPRIGEETSQEQTAILLEAALPDVLREIQKENLQDAIGSAITISREVFGNLHGIKISIAYDPELPGRKTFRIILAVSGNPADILTDEQNFKKRLYPILDAREREKITITYEWEK